MWNAGGYDEQFHLLRFAPDGKTVLTLSPQGLTIWDVGTGKAERKLQEQGPQSSHMRAGPDKKLQLWWFEAHGEQIAFLPDGSQFLWLHTTDKWPDKLTFHETATGKQVRGWNVQNPQFAQNAVAVSPDGRWIAVTDQRNPGIGFIKILDAATGKALATWEAHDNLAVALAFSPDGSTLVSGDVNGTVKVWNLTWIRKELAALGLDW